MTNIVLGPNIGGGSMPSPSNPQSSTPGVCKRICVVRAVFDLDASRSGGAVSYKKNEAGSDYPSLINVTVGK